MSKKLRHEVIHPPRTSFASRTAFDALAVDDVESEDEEFVDEPLKSTSDIAQSAEATSGEVEEPPKLSKTALKKAAKAAREVQKLQKKAKGPSLESSASGDAPVDPPASLGTVQNPVEIPKELENEVATQTPEPQPVLPPQEPEPPATNGHVSSYSEVVPALPPDNTQAKPLPFLTSPIDMAVRTASQSFSIGPIGKKSDDFADTPSHSDMGDVTPSEDEWIQEQEKQNAELKKKKQSIITRTVWTLVMISGFLLCLVLGHSFMILLVMACQTLVYHEVTALFSLGVAKSEDDESKGKDPWSKTLNWYFFAVTNYFLYGESLIYYFKHVIFADAQLLPFATNHRFISFMLYLIGFIGFVASLQKQYLKSQFALFCWVHMSLLVIVVSSHFIINNVLEGLIWFWVPASLVICNDVFAYIFGMSFGRTPLIKLSPKKTVEGFVGAFFSTIVFGIIWGTLFMRYDYMICPAHNLGVTAMSSETCVPNQVFVWREWEMYAPLRIAASTIMGHDVATVPYVPYQLHLLVMACFASLVAPFGGFFASGFKRAFDIKDFGNSIPGHGGMTDRMDCQFLMGVFVYVYYSSLIREYHVTVGSVLQTIVSGLSIPEQVELLGDLKRYLEGRGVVV